MSAERVQRTYLTLILLQTLAASLIWGVNTLFLLDAGLSLTEAFVANAAFTAGMVIFEVPTGVVADAAGRRTSFILGAVTLLVATLAYLALWYLEADILWWVLSSAFIGLGFTFFSGATEAWLVDALTATGFDGSIEVVFGRGQTAVGTATLIGTISGGFLAQISLGLPYLARSVLLLAVIIAAYMWMHDIGYTPARTGPVREQVSTILRASIEHGWRNRPVRMFMLAAPFATGVGIWVFYAAAYGAQRVGGASVNWARRRFRRRTGVLLAQVLLSALGLLAVGAAELLEVPIGFWVATGLLTLIALSGALANPMQQAYINEVIPSRQRATVLSFTSLMGSAGGVVAQPVLGRVADVYSLGLGYVVAGVLYAIQLPFLWAVRRMGLPADDVVKPAVTRPDDDLA